MHLWPMRISRTGNMLITFIPKNASVFLDTTLVETSSPARIRAIFPGSHTIALQRDGFLPYTRTVQIDPQQTTFLNDIFLIQNTTSTEITTFSGTKKSVPETLGVLNGHTVFVTSSPKLGTVVSIDTAVATHDLGVGSWRIMGGDKNFLVLARTDKQEMQFRAWNTLNDVAFSVHGTTLVSNIFSGDTLFAVYSQNELWLVDSEKKSARIILRVSKPISQVLLVPETTLAIIMFQDEINMYELNDDRGIPFTLVHNQDILNMALSADEHALEYTIDIGNGVQKNFRRLLY